ncbi:MAG: acyl carrier protein [Deltaproteobacteria bacterium]|nr:acyl carrier protein [Deltaproteobacteria bacterium]
MNVEEKLKEILLEILDIKEEDITPGATLLRDLGASSIDMVEIFTAVENALDVKLGRPDMTKIKTVQDVVDHIQTAQRQKESVS